MENYITRAEAISRIYSSGNQIFGLVFRKRTDGTLRSGSFRLGVKSHLKGGKPAYDPRQHGLIGLFDMGLGEYRSAPEEGIISVTLEGETFLVSDSPDNPL